MSKRGNLTYDDNWYTSPIEKYLEYKKGDVSNDRYNKIKNSILDSPDSASWVSWAEHVPGWRNEMTVSDGKSFKQQLESAPELGSRAVEMRLLDVSSFLEELLDKNTDDRKVIDSNPVGYVLDNTDFDHPDNEWIDRSITEIGSFLANIPELQLRAMGVTMSKTGIRNGENYNIDLPFIHLDHDIFYNTLDRHGVSIHDEIRDRPDTLYIPSEPKVGEKYRGEKRVTGNKRKRATRIPIDQELKRAILDWLAVRPETEYPHPLWVSPLDMHTKRIGITHTGRKLCNIFAEKTGFVEDGNTGLLTPHYFRHVFTTNLKPGMGYHNGSLPPSLVRFLRGDVEGDIMEVYTHDWGDQVREQYLDAIYHFGIYD